MSPYEVETIARVAHAANKEHCKVFSDFSHRDWEDCTEAQRESIRSGVRFLVDNPDAGPDAQPRTRQRRAGADGVSDCRAASGPAREQPAAPGAVFVARRDDGAEPAEQVRDIRPRAAAVAGQ